jgi:hypothetical protein
VVASKAGQPTHPAWFHNLVAHPETTLQLGSDVRAVRARVAGDEEREHLWPKLSEVYPGYDFFQRLAKGRKIPVVILEPRGATSRPIGGSSMVARRHGASTMLLAEGEGQSSRPSCRAI